MFIDASAVVAILTCEPKPIRSPTYSRKHALRSPRRSRSSRQPWASVGKWHASVEEAERDVYEFLELVGARTAPITDQEAHGAAAFSRYGKGQGHPAQLNLGDCFAYALAKNTRTTLLFKGEDFDKTDIRPAARSR